MPSELHQKNRKDFKRLKKIQSDLETRVDDLSARNNGLRRRIDRLTEVLAEYACECPEYIRWDCTRRDCGKRAADVLDEG